MICAAPKPTGKERDAELAGSAMQGNDYFGSSQGRFTAPDWSEKPEPVPYADLADPQTLNLYGYVRNNPMGRADADGHCCEEVAELGEELSAVPSPATKVLGGILIGVGLIGTAVSTPEGRRAPQIRTANRALPTIRQRCRTRPTRHRVKPNLGRPLSRERRSREWTLHGVPTCRSSVRTERL